jgi:hypothetical protein
MSSILVEFVGGPACGRAMEMEHPSRYIEFPLPPKDLVPVFRGPDDPVDIELDEWGNIKMPPFRRAQYEFRNRGIDRHYYRYVGERPAIEEMEDEAEDAHTE